MDHRFNNDNNTNNHILRREDLGMTSSPPPPPPPPPPSSLPSPTYSFGKRDTSSSDPYASARNGPRIGPATATDAAEQALPVARYRECLRNHAASVGGLVVDGCGEFMPADSDALKCTVCGCHRSFHRKEVEGEAAPRLPSAAAAASSPYYYHTYHLSNGGRRSASSAGRMQPPPLLALPPPHARHTPPMKPPPIATFGVPRGGGNESSGGGGGGPTTTDSSSEEMEAHTPLIPAAPPPWTTPSTSRKRFRTKFTSEQKEKMLEFAGTIGWRMQRRDEGAVDRFCADVGVPRKVFKVWMHNNKHSSGRSLSSSQSLQHPQEHNAQHQHQHPQQEQHNRQQLPEHIIIPPHPSFPSSSPTS